MSALFVLGLIQVGLLASHGLRGESGARPTGQGGGGLDWRFMSFPKWIESLSVTQAWNIVSNFSYSDEDAPQLIGPGLRLPSADAARVMTNYLNRYEQKNAKAGPAWGRAVFCLGLVQSETAKKQLFELWDKHDRQLAWRKSKIELKEQLNTVPPLRAVGDALGFYLDDPVTRAWFLARIEEAQDINDRDPSSPAYIRRRDREQLLVYLYRWDMIDSVDNVPIVTPDRVTSYYYATEKVVTNVGLSAQRVVEWMKRLPPFDPAMSERELMERSRNPRVHLLDSTASYLGRDLSFVLWKEYLKKGVLEEEPGVKAQLWGTALWVWPHYLNRHEIGQWSPSTEESLFLADAVGFVEGLPVGHYQKLMAQTLWTISLFAPSPSNDVAIQRIRALAGARLTSAEKEVITSRTKNLQILYKATTQSAGEKRKLWPTPPK